VDLTKNEEKAMEVSNVQHTLPFEEEQNFVALKEGKM